MNLGASKKEVMMVVFWSYVRNQEASEASEDKQTNVSVTTRDGAIFCEMQQFGDDDTFN